MQEQRAIGAFYLMSFFVMPTTEFIRKDDYIEIGDGALKEAYRVTGYDI